MTHGHHFGQPQISNVWAYDLVDVKEMKDCWQGPSFQIKKAKLCEMKLLASFSSLWPTICLEVQQPSYNNKGANMRMKATFKEVFLERLEVSWVPNGVVEHLNLHEQLPTSVLTT